MVDAKRLLLPSHLLFLFLFYTQLTCLQDFVVNASPEYVPYSLLALKNLWKDRLNLQVECFTHSTVPKLSEEALAFQNAVTASGTAAANLPRIKVTLIWKNGMYFHRHRNESKHFFSNLNCLFYVPIQLERTRK